MLGKRAYNILFHTHTVSGIVISVALYVIFFTGSFSFFRDEIIAWERGHHLQTLDQISANPDTLIQQLGKKYELHGRDIDLHHYYNERRVSVSLSASKDTTLVDQAGDGAFFYLDTKDFSTTSYVESYSLGEFLYRLHFFAQIPYPAGYYISGSVAFFFLFAILTGILIHWDKIIKNFYVFRPWAKLKTLWTDAHTTLGVIGFPFQFVYALTGAFFMLKALLIAPFVFSLYGGDQDAFYQELQYQTEVPDYAYARMDVIPSISTLVDSAKQRWPGFQLTEVVIHNYGDAQMQISLAGNLPYKNRFNGHGKMIVNASDGSLAYMQDAENPGYIAGMKSLMERLHFADYAGYGLRIISFLLGIVSCFVILSGIQLWMVAREKTATNRQKNFNRQVVWIYMAICISIFPITALEFILVKVFDPAGMSFLYKTYFIGWLALSILFYLKKDQNFTVRWSLISSAVLGLMIPVVNGVRSGNHLLRSWSEGMTETFFVDLLWIMISVLIFAGLWLTGKQKNRLAERNKVGKETQPQKEIA